MAIDATVDNFDATVDGPLTLVDFWAPWCGPCKMTEPVLQKLEEHYGQQIKFVRFNVDGQQDQATKYKVYSVPSLVLFRNGQAKEKVTGVYPYEKLAHYLERKIKE
ncbi:thioredoxin [Limosilactobacillus difficilis]|uniref:thioredoxin n=1 Tax=Limosilactobacillus difficilis TaxID=2991838 RepID=UPI0024BA68A8|nr:thioredoxin [Limosilactobacillus difficilis]